MSAVKYIVECSFCIQTDAGHSCSREKTEPRWYSGGSPLLTGERSNAFVFDDPGAAQRVAEGLGAHRTIFDAHTIELVLS